MDVTLTSPDAHAIFVMCLTGIALVLFAKQDRIPLETTSLLVIAVLAIVFEAVPYASYDRGPVHGMSFFSGFGHEALVAVCALMIAGQGLVRTGALEPLGRALSRSWAARPQAALLFTLIMGAVLSAFVNNTPIVVLLLPILISVALRTGTPPSRLLMPMGFATLVGGMGTTIGTSTNLLVVAVAADLNIAHFNMFDFVLPALLASSVGILYLWLVAPRILPERKSGQENFSPRLFSAELHITETSELVDKTLADAIRQTDGQLRVTRIGRDSNAFLMPLPDVKLRAGDRLFVRDSPSRLRELQSVLGVELYRGDTPVDEEHPLDAPDQQVAEIAIVQGSPIQGVTLRDVHFLDRYQIVAIAVHRAGQAMKMPMAAVADMHLRAGDILLVQGPSQQIAALKRDEDLVVLDATEDVPHTDRAPIALGIMAAIILVAVLGWLPIALSATAGALVMILTGCLSWKDATHALNAQVILIVVASLALGSALELTGGTKFLAQGFLAVFQDASGAVILSALMGLMAILTNVVSNNAAAVIGTPIAAHIATHLGLPAEPFVLAVLFGANMSYATPMAYKTNLLVMNAGGYTFADFLKVGIPLTLLLWIAYSLLLPWLYPLTVPA
ncbi:MAG: di/tricarboxylate transporter [Gammaproteobacteria bacterium]|jgi:di/tricarboxylate transporter